MRDPPQRRPERKLRASLSALGGSPGMTMLTGERSTLRPRRKRREIPRSRCSLGMTILVGWSLQFDLEGAVGGFIAVGHVAIPAAWARP